MDCDLRTTCFCRIMPLKVLRASVIILLALLSCLASGRCEVSVKGTVGTVRIVAQQASLSEVLRALGANFKVRYDTFISVDDVIISGTYLGRLEEVLGRVLSGLNYVIKTQDGTVEVIIVGRPGNTSPPPSTSHASSAPDVWDPLGALKAKSQLETSPQTGEDLRK